MRAKNLSALLKKGDRVAVSNITGREASKVSVISQQYCNNIVAGWALGKADQVITVPGGKDIKVYGQFDELMAALPENRRPNKVIVYSPPDAVYGDVKEVVEHGKDTVETIFVITEHVSVEVTAKLRRLCDLEDIDVIGCNTLGIINAHAGVRLGAVGGDDPSESFLPGSVAIISNSGNMVNTIASYLQSAGLGVSYGISTGKDPLILTRMKHLLQLAQRDRKTKLIVLYVEPGGVYEAEAVEYMAKSKFNKPLIVYVAGSIAEGTNISLGHAGAVVEGADTSASAKMAQFDKYLGIKPFDPNDVRNIRKQLAEKRRGIRVNTLHAIVPAATSIITALEIARDFRPKRPLNLNPWLVNFAGLGPKLPRSLVLHAGTVPKPYDKLIKKYVKSGIGRSASRQPMRNASHASSNDGVTPRIYGYSLLNMMKEGSFAKSVLHYWLGTPPKNNFEIELFEMCLIASLTNGPGTISAQGAKISASAGNDPNTAMMTTLGSLGTVHGGNGKRAAHLLIRVFGGSGLADPYSVKSASGLEKLVKDYVSRFRRIKAAAKEAGIDYEKVPCLGHPVFNKEVVNYDPREREIDAYLKEKKLYNVFLDFYHRLSKEMMNQGATTKVHAVNVDAALACICMGIAWPLLVDKKITIERAEDLPYMTFALGRVAGGGGEYLDHRDSGTGMDMRVPVSECQFLGRDHD